MTQKISGISVFSEWEVFPKSIHFYNVQCTVHLCYSCSTKYLAMEPCLQTKNRFSRFELFSCAVVHSHNVVCRFPLLVRSSGSLSRFETGQKSIVVYEARRF